MLAPVGSRSQAQLQPVRVGLEVVSQEAHAAVDVDDRYVHVAVVVIVADRDPSADMRSGERGEHRR